MQELSLTYTTRSVFVRRTIDQHKEWIEDRLGVSIADAVILETDVSFCEAAIPRLIAYSDRYAPAETAIARLTERVQSVEVPQTHFPLIRLSRERAVDPVRGRFAPRCKEPSAYSMDRADGPMFLRVRDLNVPLVALSVRYHSGAQSASESVREIVVVPRDGMDALVSLLKILAAPDGKPRLKVGPDAKIVGPCDWDQLTLDPLIISLLKDDYESFFEREAWFRKMRLPFRRGYLLHGPPGNGKSTAVRAMLTSRGLTAHTIRFFQEHTDDSDLECLFQHAADEAPAIVLLEDIDRVFPRSGKSESKVSLQQLLNCLDGVASGEGIITIATANEPTNLDPAILRRPGRFDRVVCFANPTPELRRQYFVNIHPSFANMNLDEAVEESAGFSFAQLREAFIMAAQADFEDDTAIKPENLMNSIWSLRGSLLHGSMKSSAGFGASGSTLRSKHE